MIRRPGLRVRIAAPMVTDVLCRIGIGQRNHTMKKIRSGTIRSREVRKSGHFESRILAELITLSDPTRKRMVIPHATTRREDASKTGIDHLPKMTPFLLVEVRKANIISSKAARVTARMILGIRLFDLTLPPACSDVLQFFTVQTTCWNRYQQWSNIVEVSLIDEKPLRRRRTLHRFSNWTICVMFK
jgi:hypothetical protein